MNEYNHLRIRKMKKNLFWAFAVPALLAGCSQEEGVNVPAAGNENNEERVEVVLGTQSPSVTTRAALNADNWIGTQVGIFAVPKDAELATDASRYFINNLQGTIEADAINLGVEAVYYPVLSDVAYHFYGYHPYVADGLVENENGYAVNYTLDGTQDVLFGKACASAEAIEEVGCDGYTAKFIRKMEENSLSYGPNINFKHQLTRLVFMVEDRNSDPDASEQTVQSLTLNDMVTSIQMQLTGDTLTAGTITAGEGELGQMTLKDAEGTDVTGFAVPKSETQLGESIMFWANGTGVVNATMEVYDAGNDYNYTTELPIRVSDGESFQPGCSYTVSMVFYGPGQVELKATLTDWADTELPNGGEFEIN